MSRAHKSGRVVRLTAWVDGWVQGVGFRAWGPAQGQRARRGRLGDQPGGRPGRGRGRGQRERMPPAARGTRNRRHAGPGDAGNAMLGARPGRHVGIRGVMTEISAMTPQLREYPSVRQYPFIQIAWHKTSRFAPAGLDATRPRSVARFRFFTRFLLACLVPACAAL